MKKTPLGLVKDKFGDKAKLVTALEAFTGEDLWIGRTNGDKGLAHVSNAKLLRLHTTFTTVKAKFGTREKLIGAILDIEKRTKDDGYKARLTAWPVPRLYDYYSSASKRAKAAAAKAAPKAAAKKAEPKAAPKAEAKAPAKAAPKAAAKKK